MINSFAPSLRLAALVLGLMVLNLYGYQSRAADLNLEATLVWGTNEEKSPDAKHKPVDPVYAKKLTKIFKWKNYFEVNRQVIAVPSRQARKVEMSKQCVIEITELPGDSIEVKLIGEGKLLNKTTKSLAKDEIFSIAGDDKNESAWFVLIREVEPKAQAKKEETKAAAPANK